MSPFTLYAVVYKIAQSRQKSKPGVAGKGTDVVGWEKKVRHMKIHSKSQFVQGFLGLGLGAAYLVRGILNRDGFQITMFVLWGILGIVAVCFSTDEDRAAQARENDEKIRRAAQKRFGKWAWPVRLFGAGLAVAGAVLVLFRGSPPVCLLLILGGMVYTLAVEFWLKERAERENENAI